MDFRITTSDRDTHDVYSCDNIVEAIVKFIEEYHLLYTFSQITKVERL